MRRLRSSGTFPMFAKPAKRLIEAPSLGGLARRALRALRRSRSRGVGLRSLQRLGLAAGALDLLGGRLRERVRRDGELLRELAVAKDLDAVEGALENAARAERRLVDPRAGVEHLELADVHL